MKNRAQKKAVIIVGNFSFPTGNAAGKRVLALGCILRDLQYDVFYVGMKENLPDHQVLNTKQKYQEFTYYNTPYPSNNIEWTKYKKRARLFYNIINDIKINNDVAISGVITYGTQAISLWIDCIRKWARENEAFFIFDSVDWIQYSSGFLRNIIKRIDTLYQKKVAIPKADGIIAVSRFFYDFYTKKNNNVGIIPTVFDYQSYNQEAHKAVKIKNTKPAHSPRIFIYAGTPFTLNTKVNISNFKDRLDRSIDCFMQVYEKNKNFEFHIYGLSIEEYLKAVPRHEKVLFELDKTIVFHGKCSSNEVISAFLSADFSVLNRDDTLVTRAGFPTKVVESMSLGVPVIIDPTSNLTDYVVDGYNGLIVRSDDPIQAFLSAVTIPYSDVTRMAENCLNDQVLDYRRFTNVMNLIITRCQQDEQH